MKGTSALTTAFNFRPLLPLALGIGTGVVISVHFSGAYAVWAALLFIVAAYISYRCKKPTAALVFAGLAAAFLRMLPYAFLSGEELTRTIEDAKYLSSETPAVLRPLLDSLSDRCDVLFGEASPLARAILLGDRSKLDYFRRELFRICGVSHTLALSGLHVSVLSLVLVRLIPANMPRVRVCAVGTFLCVYAALAGFPASLLRAAIMFMCILFAPLFKRRNDTLSALALSFIIIVAINPLSIYSAGFCLSFSAVAGIAMLYVPIMRRLRHAAFAPVATTVSATLGTLPFTLSFFGTFSTYSIIANIFIVPLITLALTLCFIALVASYVILPLGKLIALPARALLGASEAISESIAALPYSVISISSLGAFGGIFYFASMFMMSRYCLLNRRTKLIWAIVLLMAAIIALILA